MQKNKDNCVVIFVSHVLKYLYKTYELIGNN